MAVVAGLSASTSDFSSNEPIVNNRAQECLTCPIMAITAPMFDTYLLQNKQARAVRGCLSFRFFRGPLGGVSWAWKTVVVLNSMVRDYR
jgi:hypothetical protein